MNSLFTKTTIVIFSLIILIGAETVYSQHENVPIDHRVYSFLKEMKVKKIIGFIHDDDPIMSRNEVLKHLYEMNDQKEKLSATERDLYNRFLSEFDEMNYSPENTYQLLGNNSDVANSTADFFTDRNKYTYLYKDSSLTFHLNVLGNLKYGHRFEPSVTNAELYDIGFRFRGTLLKNFGYSLSVQKGGVSGSQLFAQDVDPRLGYNFKYVEARENIGNYDFAEGYIRYYTEPAGNMSLSAQIGRERIKLGYGYGSKFVISGDHALLDFVKVNFDYGIFSFYSFHGSTVGRFSEIREDNYTKQIAINRFKLRFEDVLEFGLGESIIYSGRGVDLAYFNPFIFYKFVEMSLQDRDNGAVWLDLQTDCFNDLEFQFTFYLDENILSHLQELNLFSNKTAYQLGSFWYSPLGISDLSLIAEYTRIRPFVYSHYNFRNTNTSWNELLGHRVGPNADEFMIKVNYNFNDWIRASAEFRNVRAGENLYDAEGNLHFNSGGDPFVEHRDGIDSDYADFLAGERIDSKIFVAGLSFEPMRSFYFDIYTGFSNQKNITREYSSTVSFLKVNLSFEM